MKRLLLSVLSGMLLTGMVHAQTGVMRSPAGESKASAPLTKTIEIADGEYIMGYCTDEIAVNGVGVPSTVTLSGAVLFSKDKTERYNGCKITKILVGFVNNKPTNASVWIKSSLTDNTSLASQNMSSVKAGWNEVTLDNPYTMNGDPLYIGFTIKQIGKTGPLSMTGKDMENGALLNLGEGWEDIPTFGRLSILAVIEGGTYPQNDIEVLTVDVNNEFHSEKDAYTFGAKLFNNGLKPVTNYEVTYQVGTNDPVTETVNANLAYREIGEFTKTVALTGMNGYNDVKVTIDKVNGVDDENTADNSGLDSIYVFEKSFPRIAVLEQFTTEKCGNCPLGDAVLDKVMKDRDNVAWIAHHVGYDVDQYTIAKSKDYLVFFGGSYYAPAAMIDRTTMPNESGVPAFGTGYPSANGGFELVNPHMEQALAVPAFISVNIDGDYDPETSNLTVTVTGERTAELDMFSTKPLVTVFLTEDNLPGNQAGAGKVIHDHVLRMVMTASSGDEPTWNGDAYTYTATAKINTKWKFQDMKIIALVNNWNTKVNLDDCRVLNANVISLYDIPNNIESAQDDEALRVSVENGSVKVEGDYNRLNVYTVSGSATGNVNLAPGLYFVKVSQDNSTRVAKVLVK